MLSGQNLVQVERQCYTVWLACVFTPVISSPRALFGFVFIHMTDCTGPAHVIYSRRASSEASFPHAVGPSHLVPDDISHNAFSIVKWVWNFCYMLFWLLLPRGELLPQQCQRQHRRHRPLNLPEQVGCWSSFWRDGCGASCHVFIQDDIWNSVLILQGWMVRCRDPWTQRQTDLSFSPSQESQGIFCATCNYPRMTVIEYSHGFFYCPGNEELWA